MPKRILAAIALTALCTQACADNDNADAVEAAKNAAPVEVSLDDIGPTIKDYDSQVVTVRGYLIHSPGSLMLLAHETSEFYSEPHVLVYDYALEQRIIEEAQFIDQSDFLLSTGCRDNYVQLTGKVGQMHGSPLYGVTLILSIKTFENENYEGDGVICYEL